MKRATLVIQDINRLSQNTEFIPTGFKILDEELDGGLMRKELIVLGGYTGSGKSYIAGQMLLAGAKKGFKSAYYSLEISNEMIVSRLIGGEANIKPSRIMAGLLTEKEKELKEKAQAHITAYNGLMAFEDSLYKLEELKKSIQENEFDFVIIDFVQNILAKGSEYETMSMSSIEFQKLAKTCNCCIMVLSQLSNDAFNTGKLEYKGSGSIATVCDLGMFLVKNQDEPNKLKLVVKKNRRGRSGIEINLISSFPGGKIYENNRD